jgi:O-Antigen ligase
VLREARELWLRLTEFVVASLADRTSRAAVATLAAPPVIIALAIVLAGVTTVSPAAGGVIAALLGVAGVSTALVRGVTVPPVIWPALAIPGAVIIAVWPTTGVVLAAVIVICALAVRAPVYAYLGALVLLGFEGSIKMRFTVEGVPSPLAVGAALIDVGLLVSLVGLTARHGASLGALWKRFSRAERIVALSLAAWIALAVLQIPIGGSVTNGVEGFRLTHFYLIATIGGVLLAAQCRPERLGTMLLVVILIVGVYAAFRGIVGPTENEREFSESRARGTYFGDHYRATGSFTSPVALASFVVPAGVFALSLACLQARQRLLSAAAFALCIIAVIASYVRTALVAVVAGVAALAAILVAGRGVSRAVKLGGVALIVVVLGGGYGATLLAGDVDPMAKDRAESLSNPFTDESVETRLETWEDSWKKVVDQPFGTGVGTIGRATIERARNAEYTDSSYLKVLQEQGFPGALLFLIAMLGAIGLCAWRLARIGPLSRPLGTASVAGVAAFLILCTMGEYIEQPGKAFVWTLLGVGAWEAHRP